MRQFCEEEGLLYVRDDDSIKRPFDAPPIVVNYFFHEEIIPSAKEKESAGVRAPPKRALSQPI